MNFLQSVIDLRLTVLKWRLRTYSTHRAIRYGFTSNAAPGRRTVLNFLSKGTVISYRHTEHFLDACIEYRAVLDIYTRWYSVEQVDAALEVYAKYGGDYSLSYLLQIQDLPIGKEFYNVDNERAG